MMDGLATSKMPLLMKMLRSCTPMTSGMYTFDIPKVSVRIDFTAQNIVPTSLGMLRWSCLLSHITRNRNGNHQDKGE